jgi:transposase
MSQESLFEGAEPLPWAGSRAPDGAPRFQPPVRDQGEWVSTELDALLDADHRARTVWGFVLSLDLGAFYGRIRAVEGRAGRPPIDPRILMSLWLYATVEGVGSARALARLCDEHVAYRWICGGVTVNHHTLSDFRTDHGAALDRLLTQSVASLMAEGLVTLDRVAQDGVRVRASAGAGSFRGKDALDACLKEAQEQVETLRRELDEDPAATTVRQAAARTRAAREREERVRRAIAQREEAEKRKKDEDEKKKVRASTTDPESRVMKMGDGGFRPAVNAQIATDTASQIVVGVDTGNVGNDAGLLGPMLVQVEERYGRRPKQALVDGGYVSVADFETAFEHGTEVYAPTRVDKRACQDPHVARPGDGPGVGAWRVRMGTEAAKEVYKERAATAECVNALARNRGLQRLLVRGLAKARAVLLWFALAHNLMRAASLRAVLASAA